MYKHIYGPIPSRRMGISLGVDPIPFKTCPLNCIYCECGATTKFTMERKEYIPKENILSEIDHFISNNSAPDFITFSGSGEPTLHSGLGAMIHILKQKYPTIKIAVITNSIMLGDKNLCEELCYADLVAPSLDAVSEDIFRKIDSPMQGVDISKIPYNLIKFSHQFMNDPKELWIEIFIEENINDTNEELNKFVEILRQAKYSKIQLNRLDRIGTVTTLVPASISRLEEIKEFFINNGLSNVEIIGKCKKREEIKQYQSSIEEVIETALLRRSHSLEDLALMVDTSIEKLGMYLDILSMEKKIMVQIIDNKVVYKILRS